MGWFLTFFHGTWYQTDVLFGLFAGVLGAFFTGNFCPLKVDGKEFPEERLNRQLEYAFLSFTFLVYGLFGFGLVGMFRVSNPAMFVYGGGGYLLVWCLQKGYRLFLAHEDFLWWLEKERERLLQESKGRP